MLAEEHRPPEDQQSHRRTVTTGSDPFVTRAAAAVPFGGSSVGHLAHAEKTGSDPVFSRSTRGSSPGWCHLADRASLTYAFRCRVPLAGVEQMSLGIARRLERRRPDRQLLGADLSGGVWRVGIPLGAAPHQLVE